MLNLWNRTTRNVYNNILEMFVTYGQVIEVNS
jgi:hypothetical protein